MRAGWRWRWRWRILAGFLAGLLGFCAQASDGGVTLYRAGMLALEADERARFASFRLALSGHPLAGYLDYARLRADLDQVDAVVIDSFLERHGELAVASRLRVAWLRELARREDWARLREAYGGERDVHVRCALVTAQRRAGDREAAIDTALALWHVGYRQPERCNEAFDFLREAGELGPERLRARMLLALEAGNPGLVRAYRDRLPEAQRTRVDHWLRVWSEPGRVTGLEPAALGPPAERSRVLTAALQRLARRDPEAAHDLLPEADRLGLDDRARGRIERTAALRAVYREHPDGLTWIQALADADSDAVARAWRVRAALRAGDWEAVRSAVARMPDAQRREPVWQYWLGRALATLDRTSAARQVWTGIAGQFGYYPFLAADALGTPYRWGSRASAADAPPMTPALARALALHAAEEAAYARLEWRRGMAALTPPERLAAAQRAARAGWPWAALHASAAGGADNASRLRFPFGFEDAVDAAASAHDLDAAWLYALIRRESAFSADRCSHRGACGLTQLMPATARWLLDREGEDSRTLRRSLERPGINIEAGGRYLAYLRDRLEHPVLAIAAYNAGPGSVRGWLEAEDDGPPAASARWIETLPFGETRDYVQAVLFNRTVYRLRLTGDTERLSEVLRADR